MVASIFVLLVKFVNFLPSQKSDQNAFQN